MGSNIELSSDSLEDSENTENDQGENEFVDAQSSSAQELSPPQQLRRSSRVRKQTVDWWKATNLLESGEIPSPYKPPRPLTTSYFGNRESI